MFVFEQNAAKSLIMNNESKCYSINPVPTHFQKIGTVSCTESLRDMSSVTEELIDIIIFY